jgi:hypothetical protein
MLSNKLNMDAIQAPAAKRRSLIKVLLNKAVTLAIVTVIFGWLFSWASPWAFPQNRTAGFSYGLLHGAMMPLSLPSLVIGRDVPIYDTNNSGRIYKDWLHLRCQRLRAGFFRTVVLASQGAAAHHKNQPR